MNRKTSGKRGAVIIALIAALAALAGPGAATAAAPSKSSAPAPIASVFGGAGILASWAEGASWAEE